MQPVVLHVRRREGEAAALGLEGAFVRGSVQQLYGAHGAGSIARAVCAEAEAEADRPHASCRACCVRLAVRAHHKLLSEGRASRPGSAVDEEAGVREESVRHVY